MRKGMNPDLYREEWQWQEGDLTVARKLPVVGDRAVTRGCNVLFYTKDDKLVKIEGGPALSRERRPFVHALPGHAGSGEPCLPHPAPASWRGRARRDSKWEEITMDEAYAIIAEKAREVTEAARPQVHRHGHRHRPQCHVADVLARLCRLQDPQRHRGHAVGRLLLHAAPAGHERHLRVRLRIADCAQLSAERFDDPEYRRPDVILNWACNPVVSNADGFFGHWIIDCMQHGSRLFVVDTRVSVDGRPCGRVFAKQPRPGTDAAVALGICNIMIHQEELYDKDFCDKWVYGMEALAERAAAYTPEGGGEDSSWVPSRKDRGGGTLPGQCGHRRLAVGPSARPDQMGRGRVLGRSGRGSAHRVNGRAGRLRATC